MKAAWCGRAKKMRWTPVMMINRWQSSNQMQADHCTNQKWIDEKNLVKRLVDNFNEKMPMASTNITYYIDNEQLKINLNNLFDDQWRNGQINMDTIRSKTNSIARATFNIFEKRRTALLHIWIDIIIIIFSKSSWTVSLVDPFQILQIGPSGSWFSRQTCRMRLTLSRSSNI